MRTSSVALLAATVLLRLQLADATHLEIGHVECPEHGEWIDAHGHAEEAPAPAGLNTRSESDEHGEHCSQVLAQSRASDTSVVFAVAASVASVASINLEPARSPISILAFAPKSSPPRV